ncbi:MAG: beta-ketoacyl-[acyl-carrier-protein] synthase family protein [Myxococcota bacterium]|nr:beta-ketoacyl-[acyl-carrier-protein] synthase family protein [Myxococcota bacterium]
MSRRYEQAPSERVVITGMGVIAPNGNGKAAFAEALRAGKSGLRHQQVMEDQGFGCHVAGTPEGTDELAERTFSTDELLAMNSSHRFGSLASAEAWEDAGFERPDSDDDRVDWDTGAILGTGVGGMDTTAEKVVPFTNEKRIRRMGSTIVEQVMASGVSARISGQLALGNQVTTNSSACSTGSEAIAMGAERIRRGLAKRMLCGGSEGASHFIWSGFDAMRVMCRDFNDEPERASRPMSASAGGFIPGSGSGVVMLESLESAQERGVRIYAEVLGSGINCGGHRAGGSMTAPNPEGVTRCVQSAIDDAGIEPAEIDLISGHLTATGADPREVASWTKALGREPADFPTLVATKSMIGHALGAAGALESVAALLMLEGGFAHPSLNCEDVHPEIAAYEPAIPHELREMPELRTVIKAGFGFGDVNACLVFRKWD